MSTLDELLEAFTEAVGYDDYLEEEQAIRAHVAAIEAERDIWQCRSYSLDAELLNERLSDADATISDLLDQCARLRSGARHYRELWDMSCAQTKDMCEYLGATEENCCDAWTLRDFIVEAKERAERAEAERDEYKRKSNESLDDYIHSYIRCELERDSARARARLWKRAAKDYRSWMLHERDVSTALSDRLAAWEKAPREEAEICRFGFCEQVTVVRVPEGE